MTTTDDVFLIYSNASCVTGRELGDELGVPHGKECNEHYDYIIRWGSSRGVRFIPNEGPVNGKNAVQQNTDKYNSLQVMDNAGVSVPNFSRNISDLELPALGRDTNHSGGTDISLIMQEDDTRFAGSSYYTEYIPTDREFRVHVMDGEVFKVHEKRLRHEEDYHPYIRNSEQGYVFCNPQSQTPPDELSVDALDALGLDFGAVDVIRGEDGEFYVLEVNTAPSLDEANLERYANQLRQQIGLEESGSEPDEEEVGEWTNPIPPEQAQRMVEHCHNDNCSACDRYRDELRAHGYDVPGESRPSPVERLSESLDSAGFGSL